MPVAGDEHHVRPIISLHGHPGGVRTRDVEGGGTATAGALDTRARRPPHTLPTVNTLLHKDRDRGTHREGGREREEYTVIR